MQETAEKTVPLAFEFNVMIANLDKLPLESASILLETLTQSLQQARLATVTAEKEQENLPFINQAILDGQLRIYDAMLAWLADFRDEFVQKSVSDSE